MKVGLPSIKNIFKPLIKSVLILLRLTAASDTDAAIYNKIYGSGIPKVITSNEQIKVILKIVKNSEEYDLVNERVSNPIDKEAKEQKVYFFCHDTEVDLLGAILLGNLLAGKEVIRADEGAIRAGQDF